MSQLAGNARSTGHSQSVAADGGADTVGEFDADEILRALCHTEALLCHDRQGHGAVGFHSKPGLSLQAVSEQQQLNEEKRDMIRGIEELAETSVKEVMIPRIDVDFLSCSTPQEELLEKIAESGHSRFPVYSESIDNVIGVLYVKDLIAVA